MTTNLDFDDNFGLDCNEFSSHGDIDFDYLHEESNLNAIKESNDYIKTLVESSGLHLLEPKNCVNSFERDGLLGLFHLFLPSKFVKGSLYEWTKQEMIKKHPNSKFNYTMFKQYIGLEIAMSFNFFSQIRDYWSTKMFAGNEDFKNVMSRDKFMNVRASLKLHPPLPTTEFFNTSSEDPLYFARQLFNRFIIRCSQVAVPYGPAAFDEASMETKARTRSKSYMPNKPSKYAVRFYALVGHAFSYLFSLFDNGSGNFEDAPAAMRYTEIFRDLKTPLEKLYTDLAKKEDLKKASALWVAQIGHMTKKKNPMKLTVT